MKNRTELAFWFCVIVVLLLAACQTSSHTIKPLSYAKDLNLYDGVEATAVRLIDSARSAQKISQIQKIAVANFVGPEGRLTGLGEYIADKVSVRLFSSGAFPDFMERRQLKQVLQTRKDELSGYFDQETVSKFGKMIGVDSMVIGTINDLGSFFDITAKIVQSETGRILAFSDVRIHKDPTTESLTARQNSATLTVSVNPPVSGEVVAGSVRTYMENGVAVLKGVPYGACTVVIQPQGQDQILRSITIGSPSETLSITMEIKLYEVSFQVVPPDAKLTVAGQAIELNSQGFATVKSLKNKLYSYVAQAPGHEYRPGQFNPATEPSVIINLQTQDAFLALKNKFFEKYKQIEKQQSFGVKLWTDKSTYHVGDTISFYFQAQRDCYVTLININASGSITQLFPNRYNADNKVRGGVTYRIPDQNFGFELQVEPPGGVERVYAIAGTQPLRLFDDDFSQSAFTSLTRARTRNIVVNQVGSRLDTAQLAAASECIVRSQ